MPEHEDKGLVLVNARSRHRGWLDAAVDLLMIPAGLAMGALMLVSVANALSRTAGKPIGGSIELSAYWFMPILVFLGINVAHRQREHIAAELVYTRMPAPIRREVTFAGDVLVLAFCVACAWFGWQEAMEAKHVGRGTPTSWVPIWPLTFMVPLGFALFSVQLVRDLLRSIGLLHKPESKESGDAEAPTDLEGVRL